MFVLIIGAFLTTFNQTIMSVAIPELMNDFNIKASTAQWLTTGYMLVNGVLIPITAFLIQRFSTRQLFQTSMIIFLAGTIVSAVASNFPVLLTGRLIQAAGAGIIMPLLMNVVLSLFPPEKRGSAMGYVGLAIIFAPAIGPTLTGYVLETFPWQAMFYGMIPFTIIVIICGFIYLKNVSEPVHSKVDFISVALSTIGFGALMYGFSEAGNAGWSSTEVVVSLVIGILALVLFTWRQLISKNPLLNLRAFKYNMFTLTTLISIGVTMMMYADMMLLPLYLQNARGFTALESGILMLPGTPNGVTKSCSWKALRPIWSQMAYYYWYSNYYHLNRWLYRFDGLDQLHVSHCDVYSSSYWDGYVPYACTDCRFKSITIQSLCTWYCYFQHYQTSSWRNRYCTTCDSNDKQYK